MKSLRIFTKFFIILALGVCGPAGRSFAQAADTTIHVQFIDGGNGTAFATSDLPASQLPDSFAANTTLTIKGERWAVISAHPLSKREFMETGKLTLMVTKVLKSQTTNDAAYAVPTIAGDIGKVAGDTPPGDDVFSIHEDDWRQVEFVAQPYEKEILDELADIHDIKANDSKGAGFLKLHVRTRIPEPLLNFTLKDLQAAIPPTRTFAKGVGFLGTELIGTQQPDAQQLESHGTVPHSFAWAIDPGLVLWGVTDDGGNVARLCLAGTPQKEHVAAVSAMLAKFTDKYNVSLVDWCRVARIHGDEQAFERYFSGK